MKALTGLVFAAGIFLATSCTKHPIDYYIAASTVVYAKDHSIINDKDHSNILEFHMKNGDDIRVLCRDSTKSPEKYHKLQSTKDGGSLVYFRDRKFNCGNTYFLSPKDFTFVSQTGK